jgi:hypothetical protein
MVIFLQERDHPQPIIAFRLAAFQLNDLMQKPGGLVITAQVTGGCGQSQAGLDILRIMPQGLLHGLYGVVIAAEIGINFTPTEPGRGVMRV